MMCAPAFSAARASPATTFPGSTAPPGTVRTTFKSPESLQQIGESFAGSARPNSYTPGSSRRSEEHTSELQSRRDLVCRLLLEKKKKKMSQHTTQVYPEEVVNTGCHL